MKLLIYGAGGLAKEIYDLVVRNYPYLYEKILFIDDFREESKFYLSESIHFDSVSKIFKDDLDNVEGIVAIGEPSYRELLYERMINAGITITTIVDKTAIISSTAIIGAGSIVCENASIHAGANIGKGCLIQPYCCIGHDIVIGDFSVMSSFSAPGGACKFGAKSYLGMHATVKEKLTIGDGAIIGMGTVVYKDVKEGKTVVGNPGRVTIGNDKHLVFINGVNAIEGE